MRIQLQRHLLLSLADLLETIPPERFITSCWATSEFYDDSSKGQADPCGWASTLELWHNLGYFLSREKNSPVVFINYQDNIGWNAISKLFQGNSDSVVNLLDGSCGPKEFSTNIRSLVKTKIY
jgi:hypothetical protein